MMSMDATETLSTLRGGKRLLNTGLRWYVVDGQTRERVGRVNCAEFLKLESCGAIRVEMHSDWAEAILND